MSVAACGRSKCNRRAPTGRPPTRRSSRTCARSAPRPFGRIKEAHDAGRATRDAVAYGLERTGRLVTAAALLFCVALGAFSTSHIFFVKQLGVGVPLAVAIDATVVRALLVPALMGRLGEATWWAPRPLRRLHTRIGLSEGALPEAGRA
jgi:uncharacterized membrane protein YdfJ with MMPL/SSD domain